VKRWETKIFYTNGKQKAGIAIVISEIIDYKIDSKEVIK
jgi:hypothetical protein